jgi:threonine synthase
VRYFSTRGEADSVDFTDALVNGLAPDGGLYVPESIPFLPDGWQSWTYPEAVSNVLQLFGARDTDSLVQFQLTRI